MKKITATQSSLNMGFSMASALEGVTGELEFAILRVVMLHIGAENRISRTELVNEVHAQGFTEDERTIRLAVSEMRRTFGLPIAGTGGKKGGYWLLKDADEAESYLKVELHDRGTSLLEQEKAVRKAFTRWYPGAQMRLS